MSTAEIEGLKLQNKFIVDEMGLIKKQVNDSVLQTTLVANEIISLNDKVEENSKYMFNDGRTGRKGLVQSFDDFVIAVNKTTEEIKKSVDAINTREEKKEAVKKAQMAIYGGVGTVLVIALGKLLAFIFPFLAKFI